MSGAEKGGMSTEGEVAVVPDEALAGLFEQERIERLRRLREALAQGAADGVAATRRWDQIHQQLDSLANAARAINAEPCERLCRRLATLARRARDEPTLTAPAAKLLESGTKVIERQPSAITYPCLANEETHQLIGAIDGLLADR